MASEAPRGVKGRRLLIVEDEYLIASDLASWLAGEGAEVLGPVPSVEEALALLSISSLPDAALLDINLGGEQVFPVADALQSVSVPILFLSGYDAKLMSQQHGDAPRFIKPLNRHLLLRALEQLLRD